MCDRDPARPLRGNRRSTGSTSSLARVSLRRAGREAPCRAAIPPDRRPLLEAVSDSMAALHERYHHRRPATIKTQTLQDELLACVMGGVYTDIEKTMIEIQRHGLVKDMRSEFQNAMQDRFVREVERLSGREVLSFISNSHVGPDLEIELFILAPLP